MSLLTLGIAGCVVEDAGGAGSPGALASELACDPDAPPAAGRDELEALAHAADDDLEVLRELVALLDTECVQPNRLLVALRWSAERSFARGLEAHHDALTDDERATIGRILHRHTRSLAYELRQARDLYPEPPPAQQSCGPICEAQIATRLAEVERFWPWVFRVQPSVVGVTRSSRSADQYHHAFVEIPGGRYADHRTDQQLAANYFSPYDYVLVTGTRYGNPYGSYPANAPFWSPEGISGTLRSSRRPQTWQVRARVWLRAEAPDDSWLVSRNVLIQGEYGWNGPVDPWQVVDEYAPDGVLLEVAAEDGYVTTGPHAGTSGEYEYPVPALLPLEPAPGP